MISRIREHYRRKALARANESVELLSMAVCAANTTNDHAAGRYFAAELAMARSRRADLLGAANPGRYCCDGNCEHQGREKCARELLPPAPTPRIRISRAAIWRAVLIVVASVWGGFFFFYLT